MKRTVQALQDEGLRETTKVIIGGNAVSPDACTYTGADAWSKNAAEAVKTCGAWA
jgi:methanogenic corrinoid protein MtbC1